MQTKVEKAYADGAKAGLDALEQLGGIYDDKNQAEMMNVYAGLLTTIMHCLYAYAPSKESADELIAFAIQMAEAYWHQNKKDIELIYEYNLNRHSS